MSKDFLRVSEKQRLKRKKIRKLMKLAGVFAKKGSFDPIFVKGWQEHKKAIKLKEENDKNHNNGKRSSAKHSGSVHKKVIRSAVRSGS